ncbi:MAG: hypothetical protein ACR2RL_02910 [Gammaproteobacteria bacterium]
MSPVFAGLGAPLRTTLYPVLHQLYTDRIGRLESYLDRDLTAWKVRPPLSSKRALQRLPIASAVRYLGAISRWLLAGFR